MDLTPMQQHILIDLLIHGPDGAKNIGNRTNHRRQSVTTALTGKLSKEQLVRNKGSGIWELTGDGVLDARSLARSDLETYDE